MTLLEAGTEVMHMIQLLRSMKISVMLPLMARVGNVGAILWQAILPQQVVQSM